MNEEIRIGYRPVDYVPGAYHTFLVRVVDGEIIGATSAYPERQDPFDTDDSYSGLFGDLRTEVNMTRETSFDRAYFDSAHYDTLTSTNVGAAWSKISETMNAIEASVLGYNPVSINSNFAIFTAVEKAGLTIPQAIKWIGIDPTGVFPGLDPISLRVPGSHANFTSAEIMVVKELNNINECFPANTVIQLADGTDKIISEISITDEVASFHPSQFAGRGGLHSQKVTRLFESITDVWVQLSTGITVTPGHHFLDAKGGFRTIADILATDSSIVLADGKLASVTGEYIHYSADTADMFEQAEGYVAQSADSHTGTTALAPTYKKGWKTYNFEVENFHTYIADGVRVHNESYFYDIQGGDTLSAIALKNGTTVDALLRENSHITNPNKIYSGDNIHITTGNNSAIQNDIRSSDGSGDISLPNGTQINGSGPIVTLASGTQAAAGTVFNPGNGYTSIVNANGSVTNLDTGVTHGDLTNDNFTNFREKELAA